MWPVAGHTKHHCSSTNKSQMNYQWPTIWSFSLPILHYIRKYRRAKKMPTVNNIWNWYGDTFMTIWKCVSTRPAFKCSIYPRMHCPKRIDWKRNRIRTYALISRMTIILLRRRMSFLTVIRIMIRRKMRLKGKFFFFLFGNEGTINVRSTNYLWFLTVVNWVSILINSIPSIRHWCT